MTMTDYEVIENKIDWFNQQQANYEARIKDEIKFLKAGIADAKNVEMIACACRRFVSDYERYNREYHEAGDIIHVLTLILKQSESEVA